MTFKLIHVGLGGWGMDWQKSALTTIADQLTSARQITSNPKFHICERMFYTVNY